MLVVFMKYFQKFYWSMVDLDYEIGAGQKTIYIFKPQTPN